MRNLFVTAGAFGCLLIFFILSACGFEYQNADITLINNTDDTVIAVYVAETGTEEWGENLLALSIPPGESGSIEGLLKKELVVKTVFETGWFNLHQVDARIYTNITVNLTAESSAEEL